MVRRVTIKNFKSIDDLSIDLGRCTVFIGANGSGKSNILEAIALASAAASDKLDNEFMASRGIRVSDIAAHMTSAFDALSSQQPIEITSSADNQHDASLLSHLTCSLIAKQNGDYIRWTNNVRPLASISPRFDNLDASFASLQNTIETKQDALNASDEYLALSEFLKDLSHKVTQLKSTTDTVKISFRSIYSYLRDFIVYSPEAKALRAFETEGQILPLGVRGEGLFRLLKSILANKDDSRAKQIKESLKVIDWFSDFSLPDNLMSSEYSLQIRDRYLADDLAVFDQRSTNEGFLYLLFYFTLLCAEETPKFFAIDNIDDSLNPRLSAETIKNLVQLAKEHDKQFLATTHQPGLLDGLDLSDPDQILYVVFRNIEGRTLVKRVKPPKAGKHEPVRLSEAFIRGYLGGLPVHF